MEKSVTNGWRREKTSLNDNLKTWVNILVCENCSWTVCYLFLYRDYTRVQWDLLFLNSASQRQKIWLCCLKVMSPPSNKLHVCQAETIICTSARTFTSLLVCWSLQVYSMSQVTCDIQACLSASHFATPTRTLPQRLQKHWCVFVTHLCFVWSLYPRFHLTAWIKSRPEIFIPLK